MIDDERQQTSTGSMLTGRQIAFKIFEHFKISEVEGALLDVRDLVALELKGDNLRAFDTAWDEILLAMKKEPEEEILESLYCKQLEKSLQLKNTMALYTQDCTQREEPCVNEKN